MRTGVVLEVNKNKAVIMNNDGSFQVVNAKKEWQKGDVVRVSIARPIYINSLIAASILVCLLVSLGGRMFFSKSMTISVDAKQSVEYEVNSFGIILSVKDYREEGSSKDAKYKNYKRALEEYIDWEYENSDTIPYMLVTVQTDKENGKINALNKIKQVVETCNNDKNQTEVDYTLVDENLINEAHEHDMTAGMYSKVAELLELNPQLSMDDYAHHDINTVQEEIKSCKNEHGEDHEEGHHKH